ncbi:ComEA family DNA-binding protein [Desulfogranum mediterraneum]|uniref:ComEA family DNA-binding protein n=1 Tax=Desulfogranum mediterraneum TaxID=160661 RepID=UPI0003FEEF23|nr:helix-hairpin-helix domain-containing protein [Desulfogranum mediterraneum]
MRRTGKAGGLQGRGELEPAPRDRRLLLLLGFAALVLSCSLGSGLRPDPSQTNCYSFAGGRLQLVSPEDSPCAAAGLAGMGPESELSPRLAFFFQQPFAINHANRSDLQLLPGIGPQLAERILVFRRSQGPFASADDLCAVPGIGERSAAILTPMLDFSP